MKVRKKVLQVNDSSTSMTSGSIWKSMLFFAVPILLGNLFQQLYNTADSLIVGNLLGSQALAAVSSSGNLIFLMIGFFNGMSVGAGVVISRFYGAKDYKNMHRNIDTAILLSMIIGIILTVLASWLAPKLLVLMQTPENVMDLSVSYFRIYFMGSLGLVIYNIASGIMRAVGDSQTPLYFLIFSSVLNVILDLLFIAGLGMSVDGAALATIISQFLSAILCLVWLAKADRPYKTNLLKMRIYKDCLIDILHNGIPTGLQNSIISIANVVVQANINSFGDLAMAGCGAYSKVEGFAFLPIMSFNMAISTFVSQNIGADKLDRVKKGSVFGIMASIICAEVIGIFMIIFADQLIAFFDSNPEVVTFGADRCRNNCWFYCVLAFSHAAASVLRGAGKPMVPMYAMLVFWCIIRVGFLTITGMFWHDIHLVYWVYPLTWGLTTVFFALYLTKADWLPQPVNELCYDKN
jgi:putative MATE family efflux protein